MEKMNRKIDEHQLSKSKDKSINIVMNKINETPSKQWFPRKQFVLVLTIFAMITAVFMLSTSTNQKPQIDPPGSTDQTLLDQYESEKLAEVGYISGQLLSQSFTVSNTRFLSTNETEFEENIDEFNSYFDMLIVFMDDSNFEDSVSISEIEGEYSNEIRFIENNVEYIFQVQIIEEDLKGILFVEEVQFTVSGTFVTDGEQLELKIKAENGTDFIEVEYKVESKDDIERKYEIKQSINNVELNKELKVEFTDTEVKVELTENDDSYELKKEIEDGEVIYKLEYKLDGNQGEVNVYLDEDDQGNPTYRYEIEENGVSKSIEKYRNPQNQRSNEIENIEIKTI